MKRAFILVLAVLLVVGLAFAGCDVDNGNEHQGEKNPNANTDTIKWTNEDALYVYTHFEYSSVILEDIEKAFENYKYKEVFLTEKTLEEYGWAELLFVFDSVADKEAFANQIKNDDNITVAVIPCRDLPYESTNTLHIECDKNVIKVGETATLAIKGIRDYYTQPFDFNGFMVLPKESAQSKEYNVSDFPQIDLQEIEKTNKGWLYFHLNSSDYFSLIKSIDVISRLDFAQKIEFDRRDFIWCAPPIWEFSDSGIVEIVEGDRGSETIVVKGIAKGEVLIRFDGVSYKLTVE